MRALIVEDDVVVPEVLEAYLKLFAADHDEDMNIQVMSNPGKALSLLSMRQDLFDVVFLDVRMPQITGDEIYSQLMRIRPEIVERIIFITGYRDDLIARFPALELNILDKPFRYRQLIEAMAVVA